MPILENFKSDLSAKATRVLNDSEIRLNDAQRLLNFLSSARGAAFIAKQGMLDADIAVLSGDPRAKFDPQATAKRLAAIVAQAGLNATGLGYHIGFDPNGPGLSQAIEGTAAEKSNIKGRKSDLQLDKISTSGKDWVPHSTTGYYTNTKNSDINATYYVKSPLDKQVTLKGDYNQLNELDLVPFYFTAFETQNGEVRPSYNLAFRSFFNSIQETTTGNYASYNFIGRGENFHTYQSYSRTSNFGFKVAAFNRKELTILHDKVEILRKLTAPKYRGGYMQGNFINLTIGNYYKNMPGFVTSVGVTVGDNVPWEVEERSYIMPHVLDITVAFTILESQTPNSIEIKPQEEKAPSETKSTSTEGTEQGASQLAVNTSPPTTPQNFTTAFSPSRYGDNFFDV